MKKIISSIIITLFVGNVSAQQMAKGIIYEDLNGNGKKDRNEKGIAGVGVSNGTDVIATNEKGDYSLDVNEGELFFVI